MEGEVEFYSASRRDRDASISSYPNGSKSLNARSFLLLHRRCVVIQHVGGWTSSAGLEVLSGDPCFMAFGCPGPPENAGPIFDLEASTIQHAFHVLTEVAVPQRQLGAPGF